MKRIIRAINEGVTKGLIHFEEPNDFNKSKMPDNYNNQLLYNFIKCQPGDPIYKDPILGFNLISGELIGYCVIPADVLKDRFPRFAYKEPITNKDGSLKECQWNYAKTLCKKFRNKLGDFNFYCPGFNELYKAAEYAYGNGLNIPTHGLYWTSDSYHDEYSRSAFVLFMKMGTPVYDQTFNCDEYAYVIPFFKVNQ